MAELPLTWRAVLAGRLARQHLTTRLPAERALEVVSRLCGLHAQVLSSAELTLAARVDGLSPNAVATALWTDRSLVKTWAVRGTLHLLPADEVPTWIAALSTYRHFEKPAWQKAFLSLEGLNQVIEAASDALSGALLTREELAAAVATATGRPDIGEALGSSWGALLKPVAWRGRLCFGPSEGQLVRFTRADTWLADRIGPWPEIDPQEALATLVRNYLRVQGPATREDLARWIALPPARAGALLRELGDEVVAVDLEGRTAVGLAEVVTEDAARELEDLPDEPLVRLLPAFDQYVVAGQRDVEAVLAAEHRPRVFRPQGWLSPVLLVDGRIEGVWRHERKGSRLLVTIEAFSPQPPAVVEGVDAEAERLAGFLGGELELTWC
jgi:uncharacterized protein YcaQ